MRVRALAAAVLVGCAGSPAPTPTPTPTPTPSPSLTPSLSPTPTPNPSASPATSTSFFDRVRPDLTACYEQGKKSVPTMTSGKITFHVAVDAGGETACVVPSDDTGLTQDVENCMRTRIDKETHAKRDAPWSFELPLVVKDSKLSLGEARDTPPTIETVESHGLAEDVYDVVEGLLPELYACVRGIPKSNAMRVVYVGARVGGAGQVECALASGSSAIPMETRTCTAKVLARAKFRAPKKGYGLVSVPLNVMSRK